MGYGVCLALIFEFFRRRKERFHDPTNNWIIDFVRDELFPVNEQLLSNDDRWERFLRRNLRRDRDALGNDCDLRAYGIASLVDFYQHQRRISEACDWQELAVKLLEHSLPADHQRVIAANRKMAELKLLNLDYLSAETHVRKVIGTTTQPEATDLRMLIDVLAAQKRWDEMKVLCEQMRNSIEDARGPASPELEDWLTQELRHIQPTADERAIVSIKEHLDLVRALNIGVAALGSDSPYLGRDVDALSSWLFRRGRQKQAEYLQQQSAMLRLIGRVRGADYPGIERDLERVAAWYRKRGLHADGTVAFHLEKRAERIRNKRIKKF